jgi:hypothetical protein
MLRVVDFLDKKSCLSIAGEDVIRRLSVAIDARAKTKFLAGPARVELG